MNLNPYDYIKKNLVAPIENKVNNAINTASNAVKSGAKTVANTVKDSAVGWAQSYQKAVVDTNKSLSPHNGTAGAVVAIVSKAKPGPTALTTAGQYLAEIGSRTVTNAYNHFIKGSK